MIGKLNLGGHSKTAMVTFNINVSDAVIVVKDSAGNAISATTENTYKLKSGVYTYSISADGYHSIKDVSFTVIEDLIIEVNLVKILYLSFNVTPSTATITVKNSTGTEIEAEDDGSYKVEVGIYTYIIEETDYTTVNGYIIMTEDEGDQTVNITLVAPVYGVYRAMSSSSTTWTRTGEAVGLTANATHDGSEVENDFDNIYPWSDIITQDVSEDGTVNASYGDANFSFTNPTGRIMTYFPGFWWQRYQDDAREYINISKKGQDGYTYSKPFYLGRYTTSGSTSTMTCKSGVSSLVSTTITNFRTYSQAIGTNWGQLDILRWSLLQMLYLVEYADYDSQTVLGSGVSDVSAQINSGGCDDLGMASGCLSDDSASAVIYRGVENPYGNIRQWLDGINLSSGQAYICYDRDSYASSQTSSPYTALGYTEATASGYIKTIGYDSSNPAIQRPTETRRKFFNIHSRLLLF